MQLLVEQKEHLFDSDNDDEALQVAEHGLNKKSRGKGNSCCKISRAHINDSALVVS